jgi:hypothetical protein
MIYTAYNKAKTISEGTYSATLYYGTDEQRRKMTVVNGSIPMVLGLPQKLLVACCDKIYL